MSGTVEKKKIGGKGEKSKVGVCSVKIGLEHTRGGEKRERGKLRKKESGERKKSEEGIYVPEHRKEDKAMENADLGRLNEQSSSIWQRGDGSWGGEKERE